MFSYSLAPEGTPGFAAITDRFIALVSGVTTETVSDFYALMSSDDTTIDVLLDSAAGRGIPDFAIVELLSAKPVTVAIAARGSARVDIDGASSTTIAGPPGATWVIGEARNISSLVMSISGFEPGASQLPIARGVVPASSIFIDDDVPVAAELREPAQPATMPITLPSLASFPEPAPAPEVVSSTTVILLELPDGNRLDPSTPVLLGRRPWNNATEDLSRFHVTAPSPGRQISSRHLLIDAVADEIIAHDLDSTNGTIVLSFGRPPRLLHDGSSTVVQAGDVLDLGESYRVTIVRA